MTAAANLWRHLPFLAISLGGFVEVLLLFSEAPSGEARRFVMYTDGIHSVGGHIAFGPADHLLAG